MALAELKKLQENLKELTKDLLAKNEEAKKILDQYETKLHNVADTKNGLAEIKDKDVADIKNRLAKIKEALQNLQKEAPQKRVIEFVGAVNSGKSSLINALLRHDALPTANGESTVCSFKIVTTEEEEWSVLLDGDKKYGVDFEKIKSACSMMADSDSRARRDTLNIKATSVLQINWPENKCKYLPANVVLYDTPGFGEDSEVDEVLKESCKKADIIVAVMETNVPSLKNMSDLLKEVKEEGGKVIFGVFTKWDEFKTNSKKGNTPADLKYTRKRRYSDYLKKVYGKEETAREAAEEEEGKVFFVDVGVENNFNEKAGTEGTEGFLKFERRLGSEKELELKIIEEKTNSVKSETGKIFEKFQGIIDAREKEKTEERNEKQNEIKYWDELHKSFTAIKKSVKGRKEIMDALFTEKKIKELLAKFEDMAECEDKEEKKHEEDEETKCEEDEKTKCEEDEKKKREEDVIKEFVDLVQGEIKSAEDKEMSRINKEYEEWKRNLKSEAPYSIDLPEALPGYGLCTFKAKEKLANTEYNSFWDWHAWVTSEKIQGAAMIGAGALAIATTGPMVAGAVAATALPEGMATTCAVLGGKTVMGAMGTGLPVMARDLWTKVYGNKIMSPKKIAIWKEVLSRKLSTFREGDSKGSTPIQTEINSILECISEATKKLTEECEKLTEDVEDLDKLSKDLKKINQLRSKTPMDASGDPTENQSVNGSAGTSS